LDILHICGDRLRQIAALDLEPLDSIGRFRDDILGFLTLGAPRIGASEEVGNLVFLLTRSELGSLTVSLVLLDLGVDSLDLGAAVDSLGVLLRLELGNLSHSFLEADIDGAMGTGVLFSHASIVQDLSGLSSVF